MEPLLPNFIGALVQHGAALLVTFAVVALVIALVLRTGNKY
ncbi:hypothetical protein [Paenibacillus mucilaginosus]|uniref:Uncharacterized protein n=3 Tax=Paenibacillus mucilaginosus TaxID=61624 RepID=H6NPY7_9BACL|nr:hypothetical protein [Paenibacillus mucilaginosus]AEI43537.1 hypothetical protein KNP414_05012 [Paenibacillus mucilaginosus KNP414]AFC31178.1 hypothetical protein PM3016_4412 [Paenibacillus mucilaginosus 3016]AFH63499.1 hypothetical protein B2K_22845 [Paenibacillus mucilaginosus K02]